MAYIKSKCDFCDNPAVYDTKTILGPWANCCQQHFDKYSVKIEGLYSKLEAPIIATKKCSRCNQTLPIEQFYKYVDRNGVERLRTECKSCNLEERKKLRMRKDK